MSGEILESEIHEQPQIVKRFLSQETINATRIADAVRETFEYVIIAARGTSDNAARYAKYLFGANNRIPVALATPSLFTLYKQPPLMHSALVIGISQSGRSPDIVAVLEEAQRQSRPTLAITNALESPLADAAAHVIHLHAGEERSVAATKTYTASLAAIALLSSLLRSDQVALDQLQCLPRQFRALLSDLSDLANRVERYQHIDRCAVIGRGFDYATAFEIALKIKELCQVAAEPYSSADFLHGPIATVHKGYPVLIIAPVGSVLDDMQALISRLVELEAELLVISNEEALLRQAKFAMPIPGDIPEWLTPMVTVVPGQIFSLELARIRGLDPDQPEGLKKITETW